jgi:hypothetical protein
MDRVVKKALISPLEDVKNFAVPPRVIGCRIVAVADEAFDVAGVLRWVDVSDDVDITDWYWDGTEAKRRPPPPPVT